MYRLLTVLFICMFCTGTVYAQEKESKKNKSDSLTTTFITSVKTQKINKTALNKLVNTGYQLQKVNNVISSTSSVNTKELQTGQYPNIYSYLEARVAGLTVSSDPSNPSGYTIHINGVNTIATGQYSEPLVVVNGVQTNGLAALSSLNPSNIRSINVLKGASTSVYGFRGANGVIVITTK